MSTVRKNSLPFSFSVHPNKIYTDLNQHYTAQVDLYRVKYLFCQG